MDRISDWFLSLSPWEWVGVILAALLVLFILRNVPDLFRYMRIRSM